MNPLTGVLSERGRCTRRLRLALHPISFRDFYLVGRHHQPGVEPWRGLRHPARAPRHRVRHVPAPGGAVRPCRTCATGGSTSNLRETRERGRPFVLPRRGRLDPRQHRHRDRIRPHHRARADPADVPVADRPWIVIGGSGAIGLVRPELADGPRGTRGTSSRPTRDVAGADRRRDHYLADPVRVAARGGELSSPAWWWDRSSPRSSPRS